MKYAEKQLAPGERILYRARYHWIFYGRAIVLLLFSIAASAVALVFEAKGAGPTPSKVAMWVAAALFLLSLVVFAIRGIRARTDEFVVTDRRILHKIGVFAHETRQCPLERIQDVTVDQSFWGRLLGYGDLAIETASERGQILFPTIEHPEALRTAIWTHVGPGGVSVPSPEAAASSPPARSAAPADRLAELNDLKNRGLITPEEFEAKRREAVRDL
ncbi:MAG TPA: PH domain-containing protein [Thermoanaerobaculia bacterium]|nr:PH domain-containing protein [Thermoanaerobaculia bacterium]